MARKVSGQVPATRRSGRQRANLVSPGAPSDPGFLKLTVETLRPYAFKIAMAAATLLFALFAYYLVNPFGLRTTDIAQDVPTAWNGAIEKLGIEALYPPGEDFNVGDIFIVISPTGLEAREKEIEIIGKLLGRTVRIGHLDILGTQTKIPARTHFTNTAVCGLEKDGSSTCPPLNPIEVLTIGAGSPANPVDLSLVGFPGITITAKGRSNFDFGALGVGSYGKQKSKVNIIKIPEATTYGVSEAEALSELYRWCANPTNNVLCTEPVARTILSAAFGGFVNLMNEESDWPTKGMYRLKLNLKLITRVYLTREISANTAIYDEETSNLVPLEKPGPGTPVAAGDTKKDTKSSSSADRANTLGAINDDSLSLNYRYSKPLVIGFKSVSFVLGCKFPAPGKLSECK